MRPSCVVSQAATKYRGGVISASECTVGQNSAEPFVRHDPVGGQLVGEDALAGHDQPQGRTQADQRDQDERRQRPRSRQRGAAGLLGGGRGRMRRSGDLSRVGHGHAHRRGPYSALCETARFIRFRRRDRRAAAAVVHRTGGGLRADAQARHPAALGARRPRHRRLRLRGLLSPPRAGSGARAARGRDTASARGRADAAARPLPDAASLPAGPASPDDPALRSYRSGFWTTVRIEARDRPGTVDLELAARLASGTEVVAPLGRVEILERRRPSHPARRGDERA